MSDDRPTRAAGAAWRVVEGEMIVVSDVTADILSLNGTGAFVWERLDGSSSLDEIASALAETYDIEPEQAARDVSEFVEELMSEGLLESGAGADAG